MRLHQADNLYSCWIILSEVIVVCPRADNSVYLLQLWRLCCHTRLPPLYEEEQRLALEGMMSYVLEELQEEMMMLKHHLKLAQAPPKENQQKLLHYGIFYVPWSKSSYRRVEGIKLLHCVNNKAITWSR